MEGISLVVQWLGLSVPLQGPWIRSLVRELTHMIQPKKKKKAQKISKEKKSIHQTPRTLPRCWPGLTSCPGVIHGVDVPSTREHGL